MPEVNEYSQTKKETDCHLKGGCTRSLFGLLEGDQDAQQKTSKRMFDALSLRGGDTGTSRTCGDLFLGLRGASARCWQRAGRQPGSDDCCSHRGRDLRQRRRRHTNDYRSV